MHEDVAGGEDPPHHFDGGGREVDAPPQPPQHGLDLGHVAVSGGLVGSHRPAPLGVVAALGRPVPGLARPDLHLDHRRLHHPFEVEGAERENRRRGVAARAGHEVGGAKGVPVQLRDPVDETAEQFGARVRAPIEALVVGGVFEAEVGAEVDDTLGGGAEVVDVGGRRAVWEAREEDVAA